MTELVEFEIELIENGESRFWSATIELENTDDWHRAAVRWLTNLCGTLSTVNNVTPVGNLVCRRAFTAIYDSIADEFRIPDYKYIGTILESEWNQE